MIEEYLLEYPQIKYIRYDDRLKPTRGLNLALKEAIGDYVTFAFLDDRKSQECLEILLTEIEKNDTIDLVYGDTLRTTVKNDIFEKSKASELFSHSMAEFSPENMVKCLPGPMPLWRKSIHERCGFFDQDGCDYADDWEMWLRAVNNGCVFRKVNKTVGVYLSGGRSQQNEIAQREEEARVFYKYSHIFGNNFKKFKSYFDQFIRK